MTNRLFGLTLAAAALLALPLLGGCQDVDTELKAPEYNLCPMFVALSFAD